MISTTASSVTHIGNSSATVFPYTFEILEYEHLVVQTTDNSVSPPVITTLDPSVFTVTGIGEESGGNVTYPKTGDPITSDVSITISRVVPCTQETSFPNQGGFYPQVIEASLDLLTMQTQQLTTEMASCIKVPVGTGSDPATYLSDIQTAVTAAQTAQGLAEDAQDAAETAQGLAEAAQGFAEVARTGAEAAQGLAEVAEGKVSPYYTAIDTCAANISDIQAAPGAAVSAAASAVTASGAASTCLALAGIIGDWGDFSSTSSSQDLGSIV